MIVATVEAYEKTTPVYRCELLDDQTPAQAVPGSSLSTLTLTLLEDHTKAVLNARDNQDVLQSHGVTVDEAGILTWELEADDTTIQNQVLRREPHRAIFQWSWMRGDATIGKGAHEILILVVNLDRVT